MTLITIQFAPPLQQTKQYIVALSCTIRVIWRWIISWPWNVG